jgi:ABC-2 type transport system permease protein
MTGFGAVYLREIRSAAGTLASWTTLAVAGFLVSLVFIVMVLVPSGPVTLQPVMGVSAWILLLVAPAMAMRSFSDERRQGTWEILQTAPINELGIVLGKFAANLCQLVLLGVPIVILGLILEIYGRPDWGEIGCGLLGLFLAGSCWLALGMLASTASESQLVSYLLALFSSLALVLLTRLLPSLVPADWAPMLFSIDPTRRTNDFALGLLDTSNVTYFLLITIGLLWLTTLSASRRPGVALSSLRVVRAFVEVLGVAAAMIAGIALLDLPELRNAFDLTRTRAYALDDSTIELLEKLPGEEGDWSIHLLAVESENDPLVLKQVDEVLSRFEEASPALVADRIDPLDPQSLQAFEDLLTRLRTVYRDEVVAYEDAIDGARIAYGDLVDFAVEVLPSIRALIAQLPADDPIAKEVTTLARALTRLPADSGELETFIDKGLRADGARPIPDHEGVRTALQTTLEFWSDQLIATARLLQQWSSSNGLPLEVRRWAQQSGPGFNTIATELAMSADLLDRLEPLALSEASRAIQGGEAAIVIAPDSGAAVIPAWQLFPRRTLDAGDGTVRLDRRFRGEEVLSGAIRSLQMDLRPWVVFVHSEEQRLLQPTQNGNDLFALSDALRAARFEVEEWNVNGGDRPIPPSNVRPVWVVIPPLSREGLEISQREQALLRATGTLIEQGEPVLLSLGRSILPVLGRPDPWVDIAASLGVQPDTTRVILERIAVDETSFESQQWQKMPAPISTVDHPLAEAVGTQALMILEPISLGASDSKAVKALWAVEPGPTRWLEEDWRSEIIERRAEIPEEARFTEPQPVVVAVEFERADGTNQRAMVVGGVGWLVSAVADLTRSLGGERQVLEAPGNRALLLAGTAWLASLDELVPSSGAIASTSRIEGLSPVVRTVCGILLLGVMPIGLFVVGGFVVFSRRRA